MTISSTGFQKSEAYYDADMNALTIPAPAMAFPFHLPSLPPVYSVATLGWNVLHAMFHIFNAVNRASLFGPYRRLKGWRNDSMAAFSVSSLVYFPGDFDPLDLRFLAFLTPCSPLQKKQQCYREKYPELEKYDTNEWDWAEELSINSAALIVLAESFDFLDRLSGKWSLKNFTDWQHPDMYWAAAVMPSCSSTYIYKNNQEGRAYIAAMINTELRELRHFFLRGVRCSVDSPMVMARCPMWTEH